jgi:predicted helicase
MEKEKAKEYLVKILEKYATGQAREHAYRPVLEKLFENASGLKVVNDPKRSEYGAPDFVFLKGKITIAYAETKDIGVSLDETEKGEQLVRYYGYSNLILTDYIEFRFFRNGQKYCEPIKIAELKTGKLEPIESNFNYLEQTIHDFINESKEPIKSGLVLAKVMAARGQRIRDNIRIFLKTGDEKKNENLLSIYNVIKELLLHDLDSEKFADMYAQTLVYGLFAARYNDSTADTFSRAEARDLVPASNPFLKHFFDHVAGTSFDKRLEFIVNELCEEFGHADVQAIVHDYYKVEKDSSRDPIIHFYEDFLKFYDAKARVNLGVFYTPAPVVRFIVRSLDEILRRDFGLNGLADASKTEVSKTVQNKKVKQSIHKVQILDPATGTGTFLNEVVNHIKKSFDGQGGRWPSYAKEDLLPRLHGFEIMMASYTIAHLKLSTTLKESGVNIGDTRLNIYLTNSLEKGDKYDDSLFAGLGFDKAITEESRLANNVKNDLPIMVILGNPPYNVSSQNKGEWIGGLLKDYKKDVKERNINALSDDYVKFIRFAELLIEKNGYGAIGMITNNSYIDGITHRQMRKHLLETFDEIYILDLHGNAKKKEKAPDNGKDENVFNIQQGVAISLFVKKGKKKNGPGKVFHSELYGEQEVKYEKLNQTDILKINWQEIKYQEPYHFFVPKDFKTENIYNAGFSLTELFKIYSSGIKFRKNNLLVAKNFTKDDVSQMLNDITTLDKNKILEKYDFNETSDWKLDEQKTNFIIGDKENIVPVQYRPFDVRYTYYPLDRINKIIPRGDSRRGFMKNLLTVSNTGIISVRQVAESSGFNHLFISKNIVEGRMTLSNKGMCSFYPLYIVDSKGETKTNFDEKIYKKIIENIKAKVEPENVLDYIYAVLHSPAYREKYKEFLKIDFPRVPYPKNEKQFFALAKLGEELRHLHLMDNMDNNVETHNCASLRRVTTYPVTGDNKIEKVRYDENEKQVYINQNQYFGNIPKTAWEFYIGGYQPAQKWLKDRKSRELTSDDIVHYQKIIVALLETDRIMGEIDKVL